MAVQFCREEFRGQTATRDLQSRKYTRLFLVKMTNLRDGTLTAMTASDPSTGTTVPNIGDVYVEGAGGVITDPYALASSVVPTRSDKDELLWHVVVTYDTSFAQTPGSGGQPDGSGTGGGEPGQPAQSPAERVQNPLLRPTVWTRAGVTVRQAVSKDKNAKPVKNSAGSMFEPAYETERSLGRWTAVKNYASFTENDCQAFEGKINNDAWHGWAKWTAKVEHIGLHGEFENGVRFVQVTWSLLYDPLIWSPTLILDRGNFYVVAGVKKFDYDGGSQVPVFLDGAGGRLDPLAGGFAPVNIDFEFYSTFNPLDPRLP